MINVAAEKKERNVIAFVSDAETMAEQLQELRHIDSEATMVQIAKERLGMPAAGFGDQRVNYRDSETGELFATVPKDLENEQSGNPRFQPMLVVTFNSAFG